MDPHSHDIQPGVLPPATEVQVLPPATEVEPTITLTQDSIDPAFRLPVPVPTIEQTQQPQDLPGHTTSNPDGQTTQPKRKEKPSKKGASVPRLRKACDSCSKRKVKCDEGGRPCKACASLDIPCTYARPSRRRGPRNRHADAIKGQLGHVAGIENGGPSSPTYAAQTLASLAQPPIPSPESICPKKLLDLLVDDYFKFIHPLIPIPHEPTFRELLANPQDYPIEDRNRNLALLASMVGTLVAAAPHLPRQHIQQLNMEHYVPDSFVLLEQCRRTAINAHGLYYFMPDPTVEDAMIAYLQGLIGGYTSDWASCHLYMGLCLTVLRVGRLHRRYGPGSEAAANMNTKQAVMVPGQGRNVVLQELSKRMFWIMFSTCMAFQQMDLDLRELHIPPPTASEPYPDLPLETDDIYITPQGAHPVPLGEISKLTGFNATVRVYKACVEVDAMDLAFGSNEIFDWGRQKAALEKALGTVQGALGGMPSEFLSLRPSSHSQEYPDPGVQLAEQSDGYREHKHLQLEIQKANFHAIRISTRTHLVEKYAILSNAHRVDTGSVDASMNDNDTNGRSGNVLTSSEIAGERDSIIHDLLEFLQHLDIALLDPSGLGYVPTSIHSNKMSNIRTATIALLNLAPDRTNDFYRAVEPLLKNLAAFLDKTHQNALEELEDGGEMRAREWGELSMHLKNFV
ncbi:MAG: hypothetical protein L6R37_000324 [Teloschistes peruensis]|nr:MAG: hypothetical protein L6R37_000324 [Teloschistes peruensis]